MAYSSAMAWKRSIAGQGKRLVQVTMVLARLDTRDLMDPSIFMSSGEQNSVYLSQLQKLRRTKAIISAL
jgi:hypothetical protein